MAEKAGQREAVQLGKTVRRLRLALGVSQMELAEAADLHFTYVSSVERGERNVTIASVARLAGALGVEPGELLAGIRAPKGVRQAAPRERRRRPPA